MNFSQMIGKVRVTRIQEMTSAGFTFELMYPLYDKAVIEANRSWMVPNYMTPDTEQMLQSQNSWIVETPETTIFVDPANGNGKVRRIPRFNNLQTPYLDKIRRAGIDLEKVDVVLCTHFHSDHYGWGTRLVDGVYVPTFPNARYLYSRADFEWADNMDPATEGVYVDGGRRIECSKGMLPGISEGTKTALKDSVYPLIESGHVTFIPQEDMRIDSYVTLKTAVGHTPGTFRVDIESEGEKAIISGDIMHHPIQVANWRWNSVFCVEPERAVQERYRLLSDCAESNALLLPGHFNSPTAARIRKTPGDSFEIVWDTM